VSLYHTEVSRIEAGAEAAQLRAALAWLEAKRSSGGDRSLSQSRALPLLLVDGEGESLEQQRSTLAELAAEMASAHCRQILVTDYEVKAKRSTYVLSKLDSLW
jgi:hypothetical protein